MKGMKWLVLLATAMITGCAQSPPEQQTINDAASALGGRDKILAVKTLILEGGGTNGNLGQDVTPEATSQMFTLTDYKRVVDVAAHASASSRRVRRTLRSFKDSRHRSKCSASM